VAVLMPGHGEGEYLIFCRERDEQMETWTGRRVGPEGACEQFGADDAFPIDDIGVIQSAFSGDVLVGKDARWLMFEVTEPSLVLIQGIGNGGADSQLYLYNDRGQQLGFNDDSGLGGNSTRDSQIAAELYPGRYLAAVLLYSYEDGSPSQPVRVSFQRYVRAQ